MFKIKKTIALILALSSSMVFASTTGENNTWSIDASALYLQPSFGGNGLGYSSFGNYAGADNQGVIFTTNGTNNIYNVTPNRAWGFQVGGVYRFNINND